MAQEKTPSPRARRKTDGTAEVAKPKAPARPRTRKKPAETAAGVPTESIAFHAYLLWERGEPGTPEEHWFRAEQELVAA